LYNIENCFADIQEFLCDRADRRVGDGRRIGHGKVIFRLASREDMHRIGKGNSEGTRKGGTKPRRNERRTDDDERCEEQGEHFAHARTMAECV